MSLTLKAELEIWASAMKAYDEQDFAKALDLFSGIADSSKILTNMGLIYATISEHETAIEYFIGATNLDPYLAIAHFQCGVSNFLLQRFDSALLNFEDAYLYLRGNEAINYDQLGLKFKLFSAEIMFNKGLSQICSGYVERGLADMQVASSLKVTDEHGVIDEAIQNRGEGYTVFSIPVGVLYRPSENKLKNSKSKDYLGKAKLVAARDSKDAFTEFTGAKRLQRGSLENHDQNKFDIESTVLGRSAIAPLPRVGIVAPRPAVPERSKTILPGAVVRPDPVAILASRRSQSVSNPASVSPPSDLSRGNMSLRRSNTSRMARSNTANTEAVPLRVKIPLSTCGGGIAGIDTDSSRVGGEIGATAGMPMLRSPPSLWRLQGQGSSPVAQQPVVQSFPLPPKSGQDVNGIQGTTPFILPAVPAPARAQEGHLTQFYNTYMDVYTGDQSSRSVTSSPTAQPQTQSPLFYQQPQPQQQPQPSARIQTAARASSSTKSNSGISCAPSRAAGQGMNQNIGTGVCGNSAGGTVRRKVSSRRRPTGRRVATFDDEGGDDGFATGEYEEFEMANIRVKLRYQGDVRGMTMPPSISLEEFVERVTTKFGTTLTGLGMKFTDEEGTKISLRDESDFELAIETARENAKGRSEGKIEIWCVDI